MDPEDDTALLDPETDPNADPALDPEADPAAGAEADPEADPVGTEGGETDEVVITIGDETPQAEEEDDSQAKPWVRELRKSHREQARALRERDAEIARLKGATQPAAVVLGPEPTFEDCGYDADKFKTELMAWNERKSAIDAETAKKQAAAENEKKAWQARLDNHAKLKGELKVKDYDEAAATVEATLSMTQRGLIVHGAENSAQLEYALGKNPATLKKLAAITDPVLFAFAVAKLETKLKVTPRKTAPTPERDVRGNASPSGVVDPKLDRLRAEADRTGDRTKVAAYMKSMKNAGKK